MLVFYEINLEFAAAVGRKALVLLRQQSLFKRLAGKNEEKETGTIPRTTIQSITYQRNIIVTGSICIPRIYT